MFWKSSADPSEVSMSGSRLSTSPSGSGVGVDVDAANEALYAPRLSIVERFGRDLAGAELQRKIFESYAVPARRLHDYMDTDQG